MTVGKSSPAAMQLIWALFLCLQMKKHPLSKCCTLLKSGMQWLTYPHICLAARQNGILPLTNTSSHVMTLCFCSPHRNIGTTSVSSLQSVPRLFPSCRQRISKWESVSIYRKQGNISGALGKGSHTFGKGLLPTGHTLHQMWQNTHWLWAICLLRRCWLRTSSHNSNSLYCSHGYWPDDRPVHWMQFNKNFRYQHTYPPTGAC